MPPIDLAEGGTAADAVAGTICAAARGAASGLDCAPAPAVDAAGIIGRGGNSTGRPLAGAAPGTCAVFEDAATGAAGSAAGFVDTALSAASARARAGCEGAATGRAGVGAPTIVLPLPRLSISAVANPELPREAAPVSPTGAERLAKVGNRPVEENSSSIEVSDVTVMTPPQTEQRARTFVAGSLAGSTRNTLRHSGQETFTSPPSRPSCPCAPTTSVSLLPHRPAGGRSRTPSLEAFSRNSSFPLQAHSLAPHA